MLERVHLKPMTEPRETTTRIHHNVVDRLGEYDVSYDIDNVVSFSVVTVKEKDKMSRSYASKDAADC